MAIAQYFCGIKELLTLEGAFSKGGRKVNENDLSLVRNAGLVVHNGKVLFSGTKTAAEKFIKAEKLKTAKVNLGAETVLPGFVECHTHAFFTGSRAHEYEWRQAGVSYQEIAAKGGGILSTVKKVREQSAAQLLKALSSNVERFKWQGVTTLEIKSGYGLNPASEYKSLQIINKISKPRIIPTFLGLHAIPPEFKDQPQKYVDQMLNELTKLKKLTNRVDIFIESGFFTIAQGKQLFEAARKLGFQLTVHAEQLSRTGATALACQFMACSADHLVRINESDLDSLAQSTTVAVLLPAADYYLKIPYPPARKLIEQGACVALATDFNPGTSPTTDLAFVGLLARQEMKMTLPEVISAYTVGAAHALKLENVVGTLMPGFSADFIVLDGPFTDLFYEVGHMPVRESWLAGKKIFTCLTRSESN